MPTREKRFVISEREGLPIWGVVLYSYLSAGTTEIDSKINKKKIGCRVWLGSLNCPGGAGG